MNEFKPDLKKKKKSGQYTAKQSNSSLVKPKPSCTGRKFNSNKCCPIWDRQIGGQLLKFSHSEKYFPSSLWWEVTREFLDLLLFSDLVSSDITSPIPHQCTSTSTSPFQFGSWEEGRALPCDPCWWPWGSGWIEEVEQGQIRDALELWMTLAELSTLAVQCISPQRISLINGHQGERRRLFLVRYSEELVVKFWDVYTTFNMCTKAAGNLHSAVSLE